MQKNHTIFEKIHSNISEDGYLPEAFSLMEFRDQKLSIDTDMLNDMLRDKELKITFGVAEGAFDGIQIEHGKIADITDKNVQLVDGLLKEITMEQPIEKAMDLLETFGKQHSAIDMVDVYTYTLTEKGSNYDLNRLKNVMTEILLCTSDIESVKYVLETYEVFELGRKIPRVAELIRMLGVCEEFTIFAIFNMEYWDNPNDEIFWIAQHTNGWGKIHAVHRLEPDTDEIKDWLLFEGWKNTIGNEYLAEECYEKSGMSDRIRHGLTEREAIVLEEMKPFLKREMN